MAELHVKGLADLQKYLDQFTPKMEANVMRGALRAGVKEIKKEAAALCPVGQPSARNRKLYGGYEGALRDSLRISAKRRGSNISATLKAGGKTKKGAIVYYAHMIEFKGAAPHSIPAEDKKGRRKKKILNISGAPVSKVDHPGMNPQPFMRPAFDTKSSAAVVASGNYIKKRLATKHGIDTADIDITAE